MNRILSILKYYALNIRGRKNIYNKSIEIDQAIFIVDAWGRNKQ